MLSLRPVWIRLAAWPLFLISWPTQAAHGGGGSVVLVADSRRFSGLEAWWANLYNENHLYFAILTVVVVSVLALALGKLTDLVLQRTGINLKSRVLVEH